MEIAANPRKITLIFFVMAAVPLSAALISQYFFGLHPCELCVFQRIPYAVIIAFALLSLVGKSQRIFLITCIIVIHAFLINAGLAFYHVGVEQHWWIHGDCYSKLDMTSPESIRNSIISAPIVRCDEIQFEFLGLSMAAWNFIYSFISGIFTIYLLVAYFKKEKTKAMQQNG